MTAPSGPITPADIKNKLGDIQGEAQEQVESAKNQILAVGVVVAALATPAFVMRFAMRSMIACGRPRVEVDPAAPGESVRTRAKL